MVAMADQITLRLPDGSTRAFPRGVALAEVARETGARDALAARVDGEVRDLAFRPDRGGEVEGRAFADPRGHEV